MTSAWIVSWTVLVAGVHARGVASAGGCTPANHWILRSLGLGRPVVAHRLSTVSPQDVVAGKLVGTNCSKAVAPKQGGSTQNFLRFRIRPLFVPAAHFLGGKPCRQNFFFQIKAVHKPRENRDIPHFPYSGTASCNAGNGVRPDF